MVFTENILKIHNTNVLLDAKAFSGARNLTFELKTGSRVTITIAVKNIAVGVNIQAVISNGFSTTYPFEQLETITANGLGYFTKVFSDIHSLFSIDFNVTGGIADFAFVVSVADNAVAPNLNARIDNAEISVDLNHLVQSNGRYDSVRIGNGFNELNVNSDGSTNVRVDKLAAEIAYPKVSLFKKLLNGLSKDMNIDGSGANLDFSYMPSVNEKVLLDQISLLIIDKGKMDADIFASLGTPLVNGLELEIKANGIVYIIMNIKDNIDLATHFESFASDRDDSFLDSKDQFRGFTKFSEPILLDGSQGDYVKWRITDNLKKVKFLSSTIRIWTAA